METSMATKVCAADILHTRVLAIRYLPGSFNADSETRAAVFIIYFVSQTSKASLQGAMKTGLNSSMTTIERKFAMSGKMISIVMIMDNISSTFGCLVVGYYATKV